MLQRNEEGELNHFGSHAQENGCVDAVTTNHRYAPSTTSRSSLGNYSALLSLSRMNSKEEDCNFFLLLLCFNIYDMMTVSYCFFFPRCRPTQVTARRSVSSRQQALCIQAKRRNKRRKFANYGEIWPKPTKKSIHYLDNFQLTWVHASPLIFYRSFVNILVVFPLWQAHVVAAFEQSLASMTSRLQSLTMSAEQKVSLWDPE